MARVTVEDCVLKVPNRFELVLLAAQRARELTSGTPLTLDRDDDKNPVVALREIAEETIGLEQLKGAVVRGLQKQVEIDEPEETEQIEPDASLFGIAPPGEAELREIELSESDPEMGEEEGLAEDALEEELEEDMLAVGEEPDFAPEPEEGGEEPDERSQEP